MGGGQCPAAGPALAAAPSSFNGGTLTVGSTGGATAITVTNSGSGAATLIAPVTVNSAEFLVTGSTCTAGAVLAASGGSCSFSVAFKPSATGARSGSYKVATSGVNVTVPFSGTGGSASTPADLQASGSAAFGSVAAGSSSAVTTITVSNNGTLNATSVSFANSNATEFIVSNNLCGSTLAGGASCTFGLRYAPSAAGADNATLTIAWSGGSTPLAMSGTGAAAASAVLQVTPLTLVFGTVTVGATSGTQSVTVTNSGGAVATSLALANGNAARFPVTGNTCGTTLGAGASCTLNVAYAPNATGTTNAALTFSYAGGTNVSVQMAGTGSAAPTASLATAPAGGAFGSITVGQSSAALPVTLTNSGAAAATGLAFNNSNAAEFAVSGNTCGATLNAGASCAFSLKYTPSAVGADSATLTISATGGAAVVMALTGTGIAGAPQQGQLSLPAAVTMADQQIATTSTPRSVTLSNLGPGAVQVTSVSSNNPGEFTVTGNTCTTVQPTAACVVDFTFRPSAAGARSGVLTITSNGVNSPQSVALSGTGTAGVPPPVATVDLIEYFHADFGHYFVTYLPDEITKLDNGTFKGWARTGKQFKAWTAQTAGDQVPVCRFFTVFFAPKSSHFYTPYAPECTFLKTSTVWDFEGEVFYTIYPSATGVCPANTVPVYRMYNDGQSGAPNHRYTTDLNVRAQMLANGWTAEGAGTIGVIMCSPP